MSKFELNFRTPLMNAAGSLGFAPDAYGPLDLSRLGCFITNPVSLKPRTPARSARYLPFAGGFLLHTGYPNPGLETVMRRYAGRWRHAALPVLVHLLAQDASEVARMVGRLEHVEAVAGVELGVPPGMEAQTMAASLFDWVQAAAGELPVVVRLPLERAAGLSAPAVEALRAAGAAAISLGPPRGALPAPQAGPVSGRLYGPSLFPLALAAVRSLVESGLPVIGAGGIYRPQQAEAMLAAGAVGVQLDTVLWRGDIETWAFNAQGKS